MSISMFGDLTLYGPEDKGAELALAQIREQIQVPSLLVSL